MIGRDSNGAVLFMATQQSSSPFVVDLAEANACLLALNSALSHGFRKIIIEGDSLSIISKLKSKSIPNTSLGFILDDILKLASSLDF